MANIPLSDRSVAWLQSFGTPSVSLIRMGLSAAPFASATEELAPLMKHAEALARAYNEAINVVLNRAAEPEGSHRSYLQLVGQLRRGKEMVMKRLQDEAASWDTPVELSEVQVSALHHIYDAWCARIGHNIAAGGPHR